MIGPSLPPGLQKQKESQTKQEESSSLKSSKKRPIGPAIPSNEELETYQKEYEESEENNRNKKQKLNDDEIIGPQLPSETLKERQMKNEIRLAEKLLQEETEEKEKKREEWMTALPQGKSVLDTTGPRTFSKTGNIPTIDETWAQTPGDKLKKTNRSEKTQDWKETARINSIQEEYKGAAERGPSLMEIHQKNSKGKIQKGSNSEKTF